MTYKPSPECQVQNLEQIYLKYFGYPSKGYFVEVGAYDGEFVSNTSFLADLGWEGIYIEPIYEYFLKCSARHQNNNVSVVNAAVGTEEKEVTIFQGETLSTLNYEQVKRYSEIDWSKDMKFSENKCVQLRLETLLSKENAPKDFDLLIVDVEGKESEIFRSFNLEEWRPKMMIVELEDQHPSFQKFPEYVEEIKTLRNFIVSNNYEEIYRDIHNTIFVTKEFFKEKEE
jgi:FkbM family methyltransferase